MEAIEISKPMKMQPTLHLCEEDLPEIKDWKVGGKYTITLEVEQTGAHKDGMPMMESEGEPKLSADFKILKVRSKGVDSNGEADTEVMEESEEEDDDMSDTSIQKIAEAVRRKLA